MHSNPITTDPTGADTPKNGRQGLRHWRHDLLAGLVVSFVSLPLSSGIAIASGAPPIYGIISSIIAGLIFPFVGGSYVTISGPAAGLAPALLVTMAALGGAGSADHVGAGYPMLLVVICAVGVAQVVMARLGLARFAAVFPASVVEGMLGAIGVLILVKALPLALGILEPVHAHGFLEYVAEVPHWIAAADARAALIAAVCLSIFAALGTRYAQRRFTLFRTVPAHVFAVAAGVAMAAALGLGSEFLIAVPANPLSGVQLPDFAGMASSPDLWKAAAIGFLTLTLIDGVESLATAQAIDRIDPFKRRSSPNKVLRAMGISNVISSLLGGLTVIPGGVKSKTCIEAGGRTLWANFANAVFLLCFLFIAPGIVSLIPKSALGAVLVYTGWRMAHPRIASHLRTIGVEQLVLYVVTVAAVLVTDLLIGVLCGTALKYAYVVARSAACGHGVRRLLADPFRDPITEVESVGGELVLDVGRPLVCFNAYRLMARLQSSDSSEPVVVRMGSHASVVDHTAMESIFAAVDNQRRPFRTCRRSRRHAGPLGPRARRPRAPRLERDGTCDRLNRPIAGVPCSVSSAARRPIKCNPMVKQNHKPATLAFYVLACTTTLATSACHTVEYYEKGALADPTMQFIESPAQLHWQQKVQYSDEGAAGGIGTSAGGGCGCY